MSIEMTVQRGDETRSYSGSRGIIQSALWQLEDFRDDGRVPSEDLLWEIRLYKFILFGTDAEADAKADAYGKARYNRETGHLLSKREVAKKLNWEIA